MDLTLTVRYLDDLAGLGVVLPAAALNARDIYEQALIAARENPSDDLATKLDAGEITPENVGQLVRDAALTHAAQQNALVIVSDLQNKLNRVIRDALRADFSRLHSQLAATFQPAADAVAKAARHFTVDTTAEEVLTMKPEAIKQWQQIEAHHRTLETVSSEYRTLVGSVLRQLPDHIVSLFVAASTDLDETDAQYRSRNRWLALAASGHELRLNTPEQAAQVVAATEAAQAAALEAERQARLAQHRRQHMPVGL